MNKPSHQIQIAVKTLHGGGLVAYPSDTVYGLGADALNESAVRRIFAVKERPLSMPLPLLVADQQMLEACAAPLTPEARRLAERFLPGALTLILKRASSIPDLVTAGRDSVGLRVPNHPVPRELCRLLRRPLVGTSANRSGFGSVTTAAAVRAQLGDRVDYVIHGTCSSGLESTVIDMTTTPPRVVRMGAIGLPELEAALGLRLVR